MNILKSDFVRFFSIGFAAGAALLFAATAHHPVSDVSQSLVPPAQAASAQ